ncbi:FAD:protein FMN transferase [Chiayiivirga flava]|uniref:FAD:protein FMN transferase n=1 Tax=Chiayiivirga flava TaxID=659595 RepID=A0A7W8D991_9GAMM|nr:FAD:protein FMN transferase [Chiayiivirga flava]MBB5209130.1 thiamine biosynthesis lipoprotein [Chiayiivirga flava]
MGTTWTVKLVAPAPQLAPIRSSIDSELASLVAQMSTWEPDSNLSRFNRADADTWHALPDDLFTVLAFALELTRDTDGAYDPTVGPLVNLWGFGPDGAPRTQPPTPAQIAQASAHVGWRRIELDAAAHRARQPGGVFVDVSSLGPGYAVDRIAARLHEHGVENFLVELGGEMRAAGAKPDGSAWRVAVERPDGADAGAFELVVALDDLAAGSSGDYRVGFEHDGIRYSHTLDPRTGAPVTHGLAAVTVLAPTAMQADALAAALMVLGPERGWSFARERDIAAAFTQRTADGYERRLTPALEARRVP